MKKCPICGHKIDDLDEICPYCKNLENDNSKEINSRKICLFLFLIIVLIMFLTAPIIYLLIP